MFRFVWVIARQITLFSLQVGSWNYKEYDMPPEPDRMTFDSLETILARVR